MTDLRRTLEPIPGSPDDIVAIEKVSGNYYDAWFAADENLMRSVLHPDLAKRGIWHDLRADNWKLKNLTRDAMARYTREGGASALPKREQIYEVTVLDVFRDIATVKVSAYPYVDFLHLAKINGRWWIVNALYQVRKGEETE